MILKKLHLLNFRNYPALDLDIDQNTTILVGSNAAGKSNFLESIYFLATTHSHRAEHEVEIIKFGEEFTQVEGEVKNTQAVTHLRINVIKNGQGIGKKVKVNQISRRMLDYVGNLLVVVFSPEDINLVTGSPSLRRGYLDMTLSQVNREYKKAHSEYEQVIAAKNKVLKRIKEGLSKTDELDFWTQQALDLAETISSQREEFFKFINQVGNEKGVLGELKFLYHPSILSQDRLKEYRDRELMAGASLIGPHRDDFSFQQDGKDLSRFGSRGEQRMAVFSLKLAQLEFFKNLTQSLPLLLLDDIFSELDKEHRSLVVDLMGKHQTILATVELGNIPKGFLDKAKILRVEGGRIKSI